MATHNLLRTTNVFIYISYLRINNIFSIICDYLIVFLTRYFFVVTKEGLDESPLS